MEDKKVFGIVYLILNNINRKKYVGQTIKPLTIRWSNHVSASRDPQQYFARAIAKYGCENFSMIVLGEVYSKDEMDSLETALIKFYESNNEDYGYNLTEGGDGLNHPSPMTLLKMSESKKGQRLSQEAKDKVSRAMKGRIITWGDKISAGKMGHSVSEEARAKIGAAHRGRKVGKRKSPGPHSQEHRDRISAGLLRASALRKENGIQGQ